MPSSLSYSVISERPEKEEMQKISRVPGKATKLHRPSSTIQVLPLTVNSLPVLVHDIPASNTPFCLSLNHSVILSHILISHYHLQCHCLVTGEFRLNNSWNKQPGAVWIAKSKSSNTANLLLFFLITFQSYFTYSLTSTTYNIGDNLTVGGRSFSKSLQTAGYNQTMPSLPHLTNMS